MPAPVLPVDLLCCWCPHRVVVTTPDGGPTAVAAMTRHLDVEHDRTWADFLFTDEHDDQALPAAHEETQ